MNTQFKLDPKERLKIVTRAENNQQLRAWAAERAVAATGNVPAAAGGSSG
jgi:hypothetical protein